MKTRIFEFLHLAGTATADCTAASSARADSDDGIVRVKSAVPMSEAITRIKADIATKGIKFFSEIDQSKLAADAGIKLRPSTLLVFGNPPLGTQFITSNPNAGLDWPVRLLLTQDDNGDVWAVWTDFEWIARRHNIKDRAAQFKMATDGGRLDHVDHHDEVTAQRRRAMPQAAAMARPERIDRTGGNLDEHRNIRRGDPGRRQCRHRRHRTGPARRDVGRDDRCT